MQVTSQMGHSKIETAKNIYGHLFAQDRALILKSINQAVIRLYVQEDSGTLPPDSAEIEATPGDRASGGRLVWDGSALAPCRGGSPGRVDRPAGPANRRAKNLIF